MYRFLIFVFSIFITIRVVDLYLNKIKIKNLVENILITVILVVILLLGRGCFKYYIFMPIVAIYYSTTNQLRKYLRDIGILSVVSMQIFYALLLPLNEALTISEIGYIVVLILYASISFVLIGKYKRFNFEYIIYVFSQSNRNKKSLFIMFGIVEIIYMLVSVSAMLFISRYSKVESEVSELIVIFNSIMISIFFIGNVIFSSYLKLSAENSLNLKYKSKMDDFFKIIRAQRHDYNFHLQCVNNLISQNNFKECKEYIKNVVEDFQDISDVLPVGDPAIGAMIMGFKYIAETQDIGFQIDIGYNLEDIVCSTYEINTIIANLLQNAIDEVSEHKNDDRRITLFTIKRMGVAIIKVTNTVGDIRILDREIFRVGISTKDKKNHEGIGLAIIKNIVDKYDGKIHAESEDENIAISIYIPLK